MFTTAKNHTLIFGLLIGFLLSCSQEPTNKSLPQRYLSHFPEITTGMVFVLPQNACIPCNKKVYQWWDMKSKSKDIHIITDHLIFKETDGIWLDTISLRLAQHNPYVTKAFVMMVESGKVIDHFPIEPAEIPFLDSTLSMRLQTLKSTSL